jgi:hypothetical protein
MPRKRSSSRSRKSKKITKRSSSRGQRSRQSSSGKLKLVKVSKSPIKGKKLRAVFSDGSHTDFGASGYQDFIKHKDTERRSRYLKRHSRNENWRNPKSRGALSRYILWNKPSLKASISDFKRRFHL